MKRKMDFNFSQILIKNTFGHFEKMGFPQSNKNGVRDSENKDISM